MTLHKQCGSKTRRCFRSRGIDRQACNGFSASGLSRNLGVELAIDDFGTGYCSLVYLEHSLLDFLKIDRLFVDRKWGNDPEGYRKVIAAMTSMTHSLGLAVIVEGVETEEQVSKLKEIGCEIAKGR